MMRTRSLSFPWNLPFLLLLLLCATGFTKFGFSSIGFQPALAFVVVAPVHVKVPSTSAITTATKTSSTLFSSSTSSSSSFSATSSSPGSSSSSSLQDEIDSNLKILVRAADSKDVDAETVCTALNDLEKQMRQLAKQQDDNDNNKNNELAKQMLMALHGDWRLVFTTGTAQTQKKFGAKINYFPLKAVQSFRTKNNNNNNDNNNNLMSEMRIENGIYAFDSDFPLIKFSGTMDFDLRKRRLEFDFDQVLVLNFFNITLGQGQAAKIGSQSGLGSESNVENAQKGRKAFFNWISADEQIATARGGGGGLALWKRVHHETAD